MQKRMTCLPWRLFRQVRSGDRKGRQSSRLGVTVTEITADQEVKKRCPAGAEENTVAVARGDKDYSS